MLSIRRFLGDQHFTPVEWFNMIEERGEMIISRRDSFVFGKFGEIACLRGGSGGYHAIADDQPGVVNLEHNSGIFHAQSQGNIVRGSDNGQVLIWGLSAEGLWVLAKVLFVIESRWGIPYERATTVSINRSSVSYMFGNPDGICLEFPEKVWLSLGQAIRSETQRRENFYLSMKESADVVEDEERLFLAGSER